MSAIVRRRIVVFSLGGTIAMVPGPNGGVTPALTGSELLAAVPGLEEIPVDLDVRDFRRLPGASLSFDDMLDLATAIERALESADGVVVSQGTDTIEETAFLLDLVLDTSAPVIVTGAMRHPGMAGADGPANLLAAIVTAASVDSCDLGCLVVFSDQVHAARWVRKTHTTSTAAFTSPNHGPLGHVIEGRVHIPVRIERGPVISTSPPDRTLRVGLATVALGDDGELLRAMGERADGLVVAGFGVGHVPAATVPVLTQLAERIPVVLASRTGAGPVHEATYGFTGSEKDLQDRRLINAGYLDPIKARIMLYLLLASGADRTRIAKTFMTVGPSTELDRDIFL